MMTTSAPMILKTLIFFIAKRIHICLYWSEIGPTN